MEKKTTIIFDKFLPEEQRGNLNKPEWVTRVEDQMSDVIEAIKMYEPQSEAEDGAVSIFDSMLTEQQVSQIMGTDVRLRILLEINKTPELNVIKLKLVVYHGKDFRENISFVQTSMYKNRN